MELWELLITSLIIPLIMVVSGLFMRRGGPKKVNWWMGYRTSMSMKNKETWVFAHVYCGKLWVLLGSVLGILSSGFVVFMEGGIATYETLLLWVMAVQLLVLLISIIPTEIALRKEFDKNGERR